MIEYSKVPFLVVHGICQFPVLGVTRISIYVSKGLRREIPAVLPPHQSRGNAKPTWGREILYGAGLEGRA